MCVHVCVCWRRLGNVSVCYLPLLAGLMSICLKLHNQSCHTDRKLKDPPHPSNRLLNGEFYLKETSEDWKVSYLIYKAFILTEVNSFTAWGANLNKKVSMFKLNMAIKELLMAAIYHLRNGRAKRAEKTTNPNPVMWITDVQGFFFYITQFSHVQAWHHITISRTHWSCGFLVINCCPHTAFYDYWTFFITRQLWCGGREEVLHPPINDFQENFEVGAFTL